jgi:hypothetical protein
MKLAVALSVIAFTGYVSAQSSCTALATAVPSCAVRHLEQFRLVYLLKVYRARVFPQQHRSSVVQMVTIHAR